MIYRGHVKNGVVVIDQDGALPEGAEVRVETMEGQPPKTLAERFKDVIGKAEGMPADFAENHDHYIHGDPKE